MAEPTCPHPDSVPTDRSERSIQVRSGGHAWTLRWAPGDEPLITSRIMELARDEHAPLGWASASLLCRQIARSQAVSSASG